MFVFVCVFLVQCIAGHLLRVTMYNISWQKKVSSCFYSSKYFLFPSIHNFLCIKSVVSICMSRVFCEKEALSTTAKKYKWIMKLPYLWQRIRTQFMNQSSSKLSAWVEFNIFIFFWCLNHFYGEHFLQISFFFDQIVVL